MKIGGTEEELGQRRPAMLETSAKGHTPWGQEAAPPPPPRETGRRRKEPELLTGGGDGGKLWMIPSIVCWGRAQTL